MIVEEAKVTVAWRLDPDIEHTTVAVAPSGLQDGELGNDTVEGAVIVTVPELYIGL